MLLEDKKKPEKYSNKRLDTFCWSMFHCHYHHEPAPRTWSSFPFPPWTLPPLPISGCHRPKLQLQLDENRAVSAASCICNLLSHFLSLIPLHPLHHKSSKSENVKQIMTSFDLCEALRESGSSSDHLCSHLDLYWTYGRYKHCTHYKSPPSTILG